MCTYHMYDIYIILYHNRTSQPASVGLAQAQPNYYSIAEERAKNKPPLLTTSPS